MIEIIESYGVSIEVLLILFAVSLIAETYGTIFGGGSFLIQPVMLALGFPPHVVIASDVSATSGTDLSAAYVFRKNGCVSFDLFLWCLPGILIGPIIGAQLLVFTPAWIVERLIAVICVLGSAYVLLSKKKSRDGDKADIAKNWRFRAIIFGFGLGVYTGFSGAGAGILTSLVLYGVFGLSLRHSIGTRAFIHLPSHIISFATYYFLGLINLPVVVSMFSGCFIAGWLGSTIVIKIPERILKPIFFAVILMLSVWILL